MANKTFGINRRGGIKPVFSFWDIPKRGYKVAPLDREYAIRNAASAWGKLYGRKLSVRKVPGDGGIELRVYRLR